MSDGFPDYPYKRHPAFETLPTANDIANWFVAEMLHEENVGGDAWWLCREPHSSCRMLAHVDYDTQEFRLLDIATENTKDLLLVSNGLDGTWCDWWMHPVSTTSTDLYWESDGIKWLADQIVLHYESKLNKSEEQ